MSTTAPQDPSVTVTDLQCEYTTNPLGIEETVPRLSWITKTDRKDWMQSGYQILVSSTSGELAKNKGDLWDSGRVSTDASLQIEYAGKPLTSRQTAFWKVKVWDNTGKETAWSKPSTWEMGLLKPTDWNGSIWIGGTDDKSPSPTPHLRKEFAVKGKIARARVYASGLGYVELSLNGKKLGGPSQRDPGYTNYDKRLLYVTHDITKEIRQGDNCIGGILGTGWFDTHDRATWNFHRAPWRSRPKLRLMLVVDYADGRTETLGTDETWQTSTGPILVDGIYTGEVYDARLEIPGWNKAGFDTTAWKSARKADAPKGILVALKCPPVIVSKDIKPVSITEPKPGIFVLDYGQNLSGHVRLKLRGKPGEKVTLRYSERIDKDGMIQRKEIDVYMNKETPAQPFQTDVYIFKGEGVETWEQRFAYQGFQYLEVTGLSEKPSVDSLVARFSHTDLETTGQFSSSSTLFNKIQHATQYAYLSNAHNIPTDCPQREKNGWTGDAHLAVEAGLMNFRSESFYTKWLDDYADDQKADGRFSLIIPTGGWGSTAIHPSWDSAFHIIANDFYNYRGDKRLLMRHYDSLRKYVDHLVTRTENGIVPFDSLGDWLPWSTKTDSRLTSSVMLYIDAKIVARAAKMLGNADAAKYESLVETTKAAINREFYAPDKIASSTQTALSLALYFKLLPTELHQKALDALVANVEKQGHIDTGIIGAKYILRALSENGRTDIAYKIVARKEQPGWGWWIEQGATTLWEDWKGDSSLNHIMFGDVSNWFMQWIAGIGLDPEKPAFKHILIRPQIVGDLTWAKASIDSPYGKISSSWKRNGKTLQLDIEIPANTTATVQIPDTESGGRTVKVGSGKHSFKGKL